MSKPVAVIILNWNGINLLKEFLPSVINNTDGAIADVIVADNGSTDGSVEWLRSCYPDIRIIAFDANHGYAGGYNRAIDSTRYEWTILLNSDVETPPGWLTPLYQRAIKDSSTAALQPKILSYKDKTSFEYAGAAGGMIDPYGYPWCRGRIMDRVECDKGQWDDELTIFWASGAALMVKTEVYLQAGGLDEQFFAHMEEIDLCWRMQLLGYKIIYVPSSHVYHLGGASLAAGNPRKTYLNFRNNLLMLHKNLPAGDAGRFLFKRRLIDTLAWLKYIATLDFKNAGAVVRAHRDFKKLRKLYTSHPGRNLLAESTRGIPSVIAMRYMGKKPRV